MKSIILKYLTFVWTLGLMAANFVACGAQMYKVSVADDFSENLASQQNAQMKDPASSLYGIHSTDGWVEIPIRYRFGAHLNAEQRAHLHAAMKIWETATGKQLFVVEGVHDNTTGDNFQDLYSSLEDEINGHYLDDNWAKTEKSNMVLATTIWSMDNAGTAISTADIRFNNQSYIIGDSLIQEASDSKEVVDMQTLALHELGHLLGLAHVDEDVDQYSIMNPTLYIGEGLTSREISPGDVERIQTIYGCDGDACDKPKLMEKLAELQKEQPSDPLLAH